MPQSTEKSVIPKAKPFLRWAGGKRSLTQSIIETIPNDLKTDSINFYEPFLGGGAVTFAIRQNSQGVNFKSKNIFINDSNFDLVTTYKAIQKFPEELLLALGKHAQKNSEEYFYKIRNSQPKGQIEVASRFIYLNKTCFNGLWRVNSKGNFNVPWGKLKNPNIVDNENITQVHNILKGMHITNGSYLNLQPKIKRGDVVYLDPPYIPLSSSSSFDKYTKNGFGLNEQEELAEFIAELNRIGAKVILSNSNTKLTKEIFQNVLDLYLIYAPRNISAKSSSRGKIHEILGLNFTPEKSDVLKRVR